MDGLEAVEIRLSEVRIENEAFRIESEFFKKHYISTHKLLTSKKYSLLKELISQKVITGHTPSMVVNKFYNGIIRFIKTDNLRDNYIKPEFNHYLSELGNDEIKRSELKENDIITTIIGATFEIIGRSCLITKNILPGNINQNIALIRADENKISHEYLNVYLNSKYGKGYLHYLSRQTEQVNLNCQEVEQLIVPLFSKTFEKSIGEILTKSYGLVEKSQSLYSKAENMLLSELGLLEYTPNPENTAIKPFSQSYGATGRLDAEYYQPKYDEMTQIIKGVNFAELGQLVSINKSIEPGSDAYQNEGIPFFRVSDLSKFGVTKPEICIPNNFIPQIDSLKPKKDTILLSKDGSVGIAYKLDEDLNGITSGAILHLRVKVNNVLPDYLTLLLNSQVVQMQAERDAGGSIIQHWKPSEISNVIIPILPLKIQQEISDKIQQSFVFKTQSAALLEAAKTAVEMAIETDEETAIQWLDEQMRGIG